MASTGDDCYYFYNSGCNKGGYCPFRHQPAALGSMVVCNYWRQGWCNRSNCRYRHTELNNSSNTYTHQQAAGPPPGGARQQDQAVEQEWWKDDDYGDNGFDGGDVEGDSNWNNDGPIEQEKVEESVQVEEQEEEEEQQEVEEEKDDQHADSVDVQEKEEEKTAEAEEDEDADFEEDGDETELDLDDEGYTNNDPGNKKLFGSYGNIGQSMKQFLMMHQKKFPNVVFGWNEVEGGVPSYPIDQNLYMKLIASSKKAMNPATNPVLDSQYMGVKAPSDCNALLKPASLKLERKSRTEACDKLKIKTSFFRSGKHLDPDGMNVHSFISNRHDNMHKALGEISKMVISQQHILQYLDHILEHGKVSANPTNVRRAVGFVNRATFECFSQMTNIASNLVRAKRMITFSTMIHADQNAAVSEINHHVEARLPTRGPSLFYRTFQKMYRKASTSFNVFASNQNLTKEERLEMMPNRQRKAILKATKKQEKKQRKKNLIKEMQKQGINCQMPAKIEKGTAPKGSFWSAKPGQLALPTLKQDGGASTQGAPKPTVTAGEMGMSNIDAQMAYHEMRKQGLVEKAGGSAKPIKFKQQKQMLKNFKNTIKDVEKALEKFKDKPNVIEDKKLKLKKFADKMNYHNLHIPDYYFHLLPTKEEEQRAQRRIQKAGSKHKQTEDTDLDFGDDDPAEDMPDSGPPAKFPKQGHGGNMPHGSQGQGAQTQEGSFANDDWYLPVNARPPRPPGQASQWSGNRAPRPPWHSQGPPRHIFQNQRFQRPPPGNRPWGMNYNDAQGNYPYM